MKLVPIVLIAALAALLPTQRADAGDGLLGVYLTEDDSSTTGALIEEVAPRSPAAKAGFRKGDRIVSCNGKPTPNSKALIQHLVRANAGDVLTLRLDRDGWQKTFEVRLAKRPDALPAKKPEGPKERGFLGIYLRQNEAGQPVVDGVMAGSPAAKAGLKVGDRIVGVAGKEAKDPSTLIALLGRYGVGERVPLDIERDGKRKTLSAVLGRRPAEGTAPPPQAEPAHPTPAPTPEASSGKKPYVGIALVDNDGAGPLRVDEVQAGSPAEKFGLRAGDVLLSANGKPLKTIEDFVAVMKDLHPGDVVALKIERDGWKSDVRLTLGAR
ncbi:MAG: PDZ domain-containing protein [Planctomycetota bacterium]|nr:MAG: PDZ domain-containing protein [Planctomycetota bacterium]